MLKLKEAKVHRMGKDYFNILAKPISQSFFLTETDRPQLARHRGKKA